MAVEQLERPVSGKATNESDITKILKDIRDKGIKDWTDRKLATKLKLIRKLVKASKHLVTQESAEKLSKLALQVSNKIRKEKLGERSA